MNKSIEERKIVRFTQSNEMSVSDHLIIERPLEILIRYGKSNTRKSMPLITTMRTPGNDVDLATGFLFSEGIIQSNQEIIQHRWLDEDRMLFDLSPEIFVDQKKWARSFLSHSSCGTCTKSRLDQIEQVIPFPLGPGPIIAAEDPLRWPDLLNQAQEQFQMTGGSHAMGLILNNQLIATSEDVGRHNAMDKLIGQLIRNDFSDFLNAGLIISSRASYELVQKALVAGIPIMVAVGAPTSLAVDLADSYGMTLIGFARSDHYNIYAGKHRLKCTIQIA